MERLDTSRVTEMNSMFGNCNELKSIDLSRFDTSHLWHVSLFFGGIVAICDGSMRRHISSCGINSFSI